MTPKLLLVKSITLIYRESLLEDLKEKSTDLVNNVVSSIKVREMNLGVNSEADVLTNLINTILNLTSSSINEPLDSGDLLQRLRLDCGDDNSTYQALHDAISTEMSETSLKRTTVMIRRQLHEYFREKEATNLINKASSDLKFNRNKIKNFRVFIQDLMQSIEPYATDYVNKDPAIVSEVDFNDMETMNDVFREVKTIDDGTGILKTGWQALNNMLRGGFRRGETTVISALQHKFKTGFTLSLFKQIALYNEPHMIDPKKKPLLLRISFEDSLTHNMQFLYTNLKENETGEKVEDLESLDEKEMSQYVYDKLTATGYHIKLIRVDPSQWGYMDICNTVIELEAEGFEIHLLMLDYLPMIQTTGCTEGPAGHALRDLYRRMRNFCAPRGITLITPHQMSTDAKQLIRDGVGADLVKDVAEKGYYAGSRQIDQEVDVEIYIHLVKIDNTSWLTVQRGKHRLPGVTEPKYMFYVHKFEEVGTIPDDINGPDSSRKRIGGRTVGGDKDDSSFWDDI